MKPKPTLGRVVVGAVSSAVIIWFLGGIDKRLANLYLILVLLSVVMVYREDIFPQLNATINLVSGLGS